jgi:Tol biopolymer transport system component
MRLSRFYLLACFVVFAVSVHSCAIPDRYAEYEVMGSPVWSPDSQQIAFVATHGRDKKPFVNSEIYKVNVNATGLTRLTNNPEMDIDPAWSPDSRRIIFYSNRNFKQQEGTENCCGSLYAINSDGSELTQITRDIGWAKNPQWSRSNNRIAFEAEGEIYVINSDGSRRIKLVTLGNNKGESITNYSPIWSPDGQKIAFKSNKLELINANGTNRTQILSNSEDYAPSWSPNGKQIVYTRGIYTGDAKKGKTISQVWLANTDGSGKPQKIADGASAVWLPDGKRISFSCSSKSQQDDTKEWFICVMNSDGSNLIKLKPKIRFFAWSPDAKKIAFIPDSYPEARLYVMKADGSELLQLAGKPESSKHDRTGGR